MLVTLDNQIILFIFARMIYDMFNGIAMVVAHAVSMTVCNCTFILATVSHNYSDIGTIEVDAYINARRAQVDAINYKLSTATLTALLWFVGHRTKPRRQVFVIRDFRFIAVTSSHIYKNRCSKIGFCSTVARIRSFQMDNRQVGYT